METINAWTCSRGARRERAYASRFHSELNRRSRATSTTWPQVRRNGWSNRMSAEGIDSGAPVRTLIVDDEPLARRRLRSLLTNEPDIEIIGEAANGSAAVKAISTQRP